MSLEEELAMWGANPEAVGLIIKTLDAGKDVTTLLEKYCPGLIEDTNFQDYLYEEQQYNDVYGSDYGIDSYTGGIF